VRSRACEATSELIRPGFDGECEEIAAEFREEMGLALDEPLDPHALADLLAIPVLPLTDFANTCDEEVEQLAVMDWQAFSAVTVFRQTKRSIVFNQNHSARRRANSISHELAHGLLEHPPRPLIHPERRQWNETEEVEADLLAAALLVPRSAVAPTLHRYRGCVKTTARYFGVSDMLMESRVEMAAYAAAAAA
jgi:Zn-dependent peptidase ImmA (M78 family)